MRDWLRDHAEVPTDNIEFVVSYDQDSAEPTTVTIQQAINRIIDRAGRTGARRLYVYFAGHGLTASLSHLLLLAANAQQKSLNRGINAQKYQEGLGTFHYSPNSYSFMTAAAITTGGYGGRTRTGRLKARTHPSR